MMAMEGCMLVDTLYSFSGSQTEGPFVVCHDGQSLEHSLPSFHHFFPLPNLHIGLCARFNREAYRGSLR